MSEAVSELERLRHAIAEREKELTLLHKLSRRLLGARAQALAPLLQDIADWLPPAMQFPAISSARVRIGTTEATCGEISEAYATLRASWASADAPGGSVEVQYREPSPTFEEGPFLAEERALLNSVADLLRVAVLGMREAAARDRAQQELRVSEDRLQVALLAAQMGTIEWDIPTGIAHISELTRRIFDLPEGMTHATREQFRERIHPDHRLAVREGFERELAGAPARETEFRVVWRDGTIRWVMVRARVAFNSEGVAVRRSGVVVDVTDRHGLEDQLRHAQKMEAVGLLAGGVAHDFNNLLTVIGAAAEFAAIDAPAGTQLQADIQDISDAVERARALTAQLLTFSRRKVVHPTHLDLAAVVGRTEKMLRRLLDATIALTLRHGDSVLPVFADAGQIEQVLVNLAVNARDAMPNGGALTIVTSMVSVDEAVAELRPELVPGQYALLTVSDTGSGMEESTVARIFEPFFTTKEAGRGTGLGLATVFGIVKQAGGHIFVYSEVGFGTTFRIYLPRSTGESELPGTPTPLVAAMSRGVETVLLVEDEPHVRFLARRILVECGYAVLEASTGREALEIAHSHAGVIHLLLSDVVLPELNGREVADTLTSARPDMRVLFMSGYTADALLHHRITESGTPFIEKPFTRSGLSNAARAALDGPVPSRRGFGDR